MNFSIRWRRLDRPGQESCRLFFEDSLWHMVGEAEFAHNDFPCRLDYSVICDSSWQTRSARVWGHVGQRPVDVSLAVDSARRWRLNGDDCPQVEGCIDVDLNFSPSTNLLPIRRLGLGIGEEAKVRAAWLRFPSFALEPLEQIYRRIDETTYRYESAGGKFVRDLQVNSAGFVVDYPNFCRAED